MGVAPKFTQDADPRLEALMDGLFHRTGVDGVYARTGRYESVVEALAALISTYRDPSAEVLRFPPVMSRAQLERHGYLKSFPNLLGCVSCLCGSEREIRGVVVQEEPRCDASRERHAQRQGQDQAIAPPAPLENKDVPEAAVAHQHGGQRRHDGQLHHQRREKHLLG